MDLELSPEEKAYQQELRELLQREVTEEVVAETISMKGLGPHSFKLLRKLGEKGLLAPSWPVQYGGLGLSHVTQAIMGNELGYCHGPYPLNGLVIGNTLLQVGSDSQKEYYLPKIAKGEIEFALGYTEPQSGSDLASIEIRAVESGNKFIINGQKIYNSEAHCAQYHWLAARTDTSVPKHKGLSLFIVDLASPGITIRPLITMAGLRTNEVFYDDVRVPKENLVGEKNKGWDSMMMALTRERAVSIGEDHRWFDELVKYVLQSIKDNHARFQETQILEKLAQLAMEIHIGYLLIYRASSLVDDGIPLRYESSMAKTFVRELRQRLFITAMEILGPYGQIRQGSKWAMLDGQILRGYLYMTQGTIVAGTSEIQRNIMAIRGLGLPR
jgi:alkylation response protein AidB-like acyl-CoA dehydrogenase